MGIAVLLRCNGHWCTRREATKCFVYSSADRQFINTSFFWAVVQSFCDLLCEIHCLLQAPDPALRIAVVEDCHQFAATLPGRHSSPSFASNGIARKCGL